MGAIRPFGTAQGHRLPSVGDAAPTRLLGELDELGAAVGLDVTEALGALVEDDVELALLDPLIEPGAAEDEAADPVDEAAVGRTDEVLPVLVDVLTEGGAGLGDLAADREVEKVVELLLAEALADEGQLHRGLLDPLGEILLVEREAELSVLQYVIGARLVIPSAGRFLIHELKPGRDASPASQGVDLADHPSSVPCWA